MKRIALLVALLVAAPTFANTDLKADTATTIVIGPLVDAADATAETGLTISQADVLLWKEGGTTLAQKNESTSCTHRSNGLYTCPLNTTDTNTEGVLTVNVAESGTMVWRGNFNVLSATYYDAKYVGIEDSSDIATAVATELGDGAGFTALATAANLTSLNNDVDDLATAVGSPSDLGSGATVADNLADIEEQTDDIVDITGAFLNCEVNTANFAGDADEFACILTDLDGSSVTQATGDLTGLLIVVTSGDQNREQRYINSTTWDGGNSELQLQLSRALPGTLADAVTVVIK